MDSLIKNFSSLEEPLLFLTTPLPTLLRMAFLMLLGWVLVLVQIFPDQWRRWKSTTVIRAASSLLAGLRMGRHFCHFGTVLNGPLWVQFDPWFSRACFNPLF